MTLRILKRAKKAKKVKKRGRILQLINNIKN
jgi:hypothetical protein